ncbi:hypothetical protein M885DRAFT_563941 [Pelagophyceae sp. CCMP2097]|nr:hypothetical protein M885DRAFT_563941 [Pelagophyceae sp. CCMP2097]
MAEDGEGFRVEAAKSSGELGHISAAPIDGNAAFRAPCAACGETVENWVCLTCHAVLCSRYRNGHCAYLDCFLIPELHAACAELHRAKFGTEPQLPAPAFTIDLAPPAQDEAR